MASGIKISTFRAFKSRNYRLYFAGQSISLIGTWMQKTAVPWVIYIQTHSLFMLGLSAFATQFPSFLFSLFGGVVSDRYNKYRVLLATQVLSMIQAFLLAILVLYNHYTAWEIMGVSIILGIINAFDVPARQSLVYNMVDNKEDLPNAIALNSSMVNLAKIAGPAFAGLVLEKLGAGLCFMLNAVSFLAVIISLLFMRFDKPITSDRSKKPIKELKEGFTYVITTPEIGFILLFISIMSLLVLPYDALLSVYAKDIFNGNATTLGYLNSFIGVGAIGGTIFLASLKDKSNLKTILLIATFIFGIGLILFSHITDVKWACVFAILMGFGMMALSTISNTILQTTAATEMRGRVISYFAMAFFGMRPIGSLLIGWIAKHIGAPDTVLMEGIAALLVFGVFLYFLRKGVLKKRDKIEIEMEDEIMEKA